MKRIGFALLVVCVPALILWLAYPRHEEASRAAKPNATSAATTDNNSTVIKYGYIDTPAGSVGFSKNLAHPRGFVVSPTNQYRLDQEVIIHHSALTNATPANPK